MTSSDKRLKKVPTICDVIAALENDLNTALAISHMNAMAKAIRKESDRTQKELIKANLFASMVLLGFIKPQGVLPELREKNE